jgi:hypothetical protein
MRSYAFYRPIYSQKRHFLVYLSEGGHIYVFAGNRGAPTKPYNPFSSVGAEEQKTLTGDGCGSINQSPLPVLMIGAVEHTNVLEV